MTGNVNDAMTIKLDYELPEYPEFDAQYRRAPRRESHLSEADKALAIKNALRYIHPDHHEQMAKEFAQELEEHGRIYGYRFRPAGKLYGKPIDEYKGACIEGRAIQVMIDNNLDFDVALYPYELVTYGETGQVCQNWMQYRLIKKYLEVLTDEQTLVVMSGHPLGLFHSHKLAPRVIISNGLMVHGEREGGIAGVGHAIDVFFAQQLTAAAPQRFHRSTGGRDAFRQSLLAIGKIVMRFGSRERHFRNASSRCQRIRQREHILLKNLQ